MTLKYKKITRKTWNYKKYIPRCPLKGAFEIDYKGDTYFVVNGKKHRENGPAMIRADGTQYYYQNDMLHRIDGPAAIWFDGIAFYYQNDQLHRIDGPAAIYPDGHEYYLLFDQEYTKEEWEPLALQLNLKEQIV